MPALRRVMSFLRRIVCNPSLHGALVLAGLLWLFFRTPLARYDETYYSSADLMQDFSLTRIEAGHVSGNKLMSDQVTEMQPWLMFNRDELAAGRVPLWNTYNGAGCPHFANSQSAVFSLFSLPFYVMSFKAALLVSAFMKLYALGLLTFLFLKELRLRQFPALIGATAFMFGGHNILLLSFPHVGALAVLPASFLFVEKTLRKFEGWTSALARGESAERPRLFWPMAGLTISLTVGLLAGQPEVFYFSLVTTCSYILGRLFVLRVKSRKDHTAAVRIWKLALQLCVSGLIAAGMCAFKILSFFEFLENSRLFEQRSLTQTPLSPHFWPLSMFPNVLGNPSTPYNLSYSVPPPNYELVNMVYIGGFAMFLALVSLCFARRDRHVAFFATVAAVWAVYAYDLFGASAFFEAIPTVGIAPMNRSQGVWLFSIACCAALAVDHLMKRVDRPRFSLATGTLLAALAFLVTFLLGADRLIEKFATFESPNHALFSKYVPDHIQSMSRLFAIGTTAVLVAWLVRNEFARFACGAAMLAVVFAHSGGLLDDYNPLCENRFFFPVTPAIQELQAKVGDKRLAILGEDQIPPDANMPYHLSIINNYDGMWVRRYDHLYRDTYGDTHNWRPILKGTARGLQIFGVEYVLAKWGWNFIDSGFNPLERSGDLKFNPHEILPAREVTQTLKCHHNNLQAVAVFLSTYPRAKETSIEFKLEEVKSGKLIVQRTMSIAEVQGDIYTQHHVVFPSDYQVTPPGRNVVFAFEPQVDSSGKTYKFTLSSADGRASSTVVAWSAPILAYGEGQSTYAGKPLPGEILFDFSYNLDAFELVSRIGDYSLFHFKYALPTCHVVQGAVIAESDGEALELLRAPTFDPKSLVVLSLDKAQPAAAVSALGPIDNSKQRLVKTDDNVRVYMVAADGKSLVHIENEMVFLINKFKWEQIETIPNDEFDKFTVLKDDVQTEIEHGLRVVVPESKYATPLKVLAQSPTRIEMELVRYYPVYVVISQAWFPGWKAKINGVEVPVYRANYAFDAIQVPKGKSLIEFYYDPAPLKYGGLISLASAVIGVLLFFFRPSA